MRTSAVILTRIKLSFNSDVLPEGGRPTRRDEQRRGHSLMFRLTSFKQKKTISDGLMCSREAVTFSSSFLTWVAKLSSGIEAILLCFGSESMERGRKISPCCSRDDGRRDRWENCGIKSLDRGIEDATLSGKLPIRFPILQDLGSGLATAAVHDHDWTITSAKLWKPGLSSFQRL